MRKTQLRAWMAVFAALAPCAARAAEASMSVDVASAYVFRGATINDGPVVQPGLDVRGLPVDLGVWGNLDIDDYDGSLESGQFSEIDLYASYTLPVSVCEIVVGYTEYTYAASGTDADREVSLSVGLDAPLAPSVAAYYGIEGGIEKALYVEAGLSHDFELSDDVSLGIETAVGYVSPDDGESGFSHAQASATAGYGILSASITYVARIDEDVLPDTEDGGAYDVSVIGTLGVNVDF